MYCTLVAYVLLNVSFVLITEPKSHYVTTIFKRFFPCHLSGGGSLPRSEGATSTASWSSSTCPAACTGKGDCAHPTLAWCSDLRELFWDRVVGPLGRGGLSNKVRREATIFFSVERRTRTVIPHVWRKRGKQVWYKRPFSCLPFFWGKTSFMPLTFVSYECNRSLVRFPSLEEVSIWHAPFSYFLRSSSFYFTTQQISPVLTRLLVCLESSRPPPSPPVDITHIRFFLLLLPPRLPPGGIGGGEERTMA